MKSDGLFEIVKQSVTMRAVAEQYGLEVKRGGMIVCPFHADKNPSMKLNKDYYYCFGCGATGDAIDFVAHLFHLSAPQAAEKIAADFGLSYDRRKPRAPPRRMATKEQIVKQREIYTFRVLCKYFQLLQGWIVEYKPRDFEEEINPKFVEAVQRQEFVEYLLDRLMSGSPEEKAEICSERNRDIRWIAHRLAQLHHKTAKITSERE